MDRVLGCCKWCCCVGKSISDQENGMEGGEYVYECQEREERIKRVLGVGKVCQNMENKIMNIVMGRKSLEKELVSGKQDRMRMQSVVRVWKMS